MARPCSSGLVRFEMSTGTDWPRLEDPLVDVELHFCELDPSHVHALLVRLGTFLLLPFFHVLDSSLAIGCSSWTPNASTIEVSQVIHVCDPFTILLWTDHHLLVSFCWPWIVDVAITPWRRDLRKILWQDCIEELDHLIWRH